MKSKDKRISATRFSIFVSLILLIIGVAYVVLMYFLLQRPGTFSRTVHALSIAFSVLVIFTTLSWILALISNRVRIGCRYLNRLIKWMLNFVFYPLSRFLGFFAFSNRESLIESYLNFNNQVVMIERRKVHNSNILVLLPHCLQKEDCTVRITSDIMNCEDCGGCDITTVKKLIVRQNVKAAVATGGSLARKLILDNKPGVIVAVACHRDLLEGLRSTWRYPVYAVLNERPKGPCKETTVSVADVEFAIQSFQRES